VQELEDKFANADYEPTVADKTQRKEALNNLMKNMEDMQKLANDVEQSYVAAFEKIGETI
jgi:hypothetical protein